MILGNDNTNYTTQNNATFVSKPIENYHNNQRSNISSISLGADNAQLVSEHKYNFAHK